MEKKIRLRNNKDFERVYKKNKSYGNRNFVLLTRNNGLSHPRIGFSINKKTGNSVKRNLLKRRLREIVRINIDKINYPMDMIIIPRKGTVDLEYKQLESSLLHLFSVMRRRRRR